MQIFTRSRMRSSGNSLVDFHERVSTMEKVLVLIYNESEFTMKRPTQHLCLIETDE
jgi:hypothetical protein